MTAVQRLYLIAADAVLVVHFAFVLFVVLGWLAIWLGGWRRWQWVRNFWFRLSHLGAIGFVAAEAIMGMACPLTVWENRLRLMAGAEQRYEESFIQHWLHGILFFEFEGWVFTAMYVGFFLLVALSWWLVPVQWRRGQ
jgi:hypothetical protein